MKSIVSIILFCFVAVNLFAQALVNKGAALVIKNDAYVNLKNGDYINKCSSSTNGIIKIDGVLKLDGSLINNTVSTNVLLNPDNNGEVIFYGLNRSNIGRAHV